MGYIQESEVPRMKKSFIEVAAAEILDRNRTTEPKEFKKNYPHYNFNDNTSLGGSTRFDSSFKNHGADEIVESDFGLTNVCVRPRTKRVIAVPKQKILEDLCICDEDIPEPVVLKPRPYEPVTRVTKVAYCNPIETIADNVSMV